MDIAKLSFHIERILKNKQYILNGYNDSRSFMYIDDAINATMKIIQEKKCLNQTINVGSIDEQKILHVKHACRGGQCRRDHDGL
jgi:nucleoside-diphosphate-sugar epimerase